MLGLGYCVLTQEVAGMVNDNETRTEKGLSLARGPALVLGTILLAAGLYFIYKQHTFPKLANFPNGKAPVDSKVLFGIFGANGWTGMLTAIGGGLLLFGAAQHLLAKTMSLIVGIALAAAAIIAASSGDALGLAAANGWTEIAWGIAAAILLFNTLIPRRRRTVVADTGYAGERTGRRRRGVGTGAAVGAGAATGAVAEHEHDRHRERVDERERERVDGDREPATERQAVADRGTPGETAGENDPAFEERVANPEQHRV
ncbi:MAG: hypothetical protein WCB67_16480 [Solirubrobacteraceae bacterium]